MHQVAEWRDIVYLRKTQGPFLSLESIPLVSIQSRVLIFSPILPTSFLHEITRFEPF